MIINICIFIVRYRLTNTLLFLFINLFDFIQYSSHDHLDFQVKPFKIFHLNLNLIDVLILWVKQNPQSIIFLSKHLFYFSLVFLKSDFQTYKFNPIINIKTLKIYPIFWQDNLILSKVCNNLHSLILWYYGTFFFPFFS